MRAPCRASRAAFSQRESRSERYRLRRRDEAIQHKRSPVTSLDPLLSNGLVLWEPLPIEVDDKVAEASEVSYRYDFVLTDLRL